MLEYKNHTLLMKKTTKISLGEIDTLFLTKTAEKPYPLSPYIPI